jgi:hypothetical protein
MYRSREGFSFFLANSHNRRVLMGKLIVRVMRVLPLYAVLLLPPALAEAHITQVAITTTESPTFGGYSWPGVGPYEKRLLLDSRVVELDEVVQPDFCHDLFLQALIFQWP